MQSIHGFDFFSLSFDDKGNLTSGEFEDCKRRAAAATDVIVLAQASMARVVDSLSAQDKPVPILSSPRAAILRVAELVRGG